MSSSLVYVDLVDAAGASFWAGSLPAVLRPGDLIHVPDIGILQARDEPQEWQVNNGHDAQGIVICAFQ